MTGKFELSKNGYNNQKSELTPSLNWDKIGSHDLKRYTDVLQVATDSVPSVITGLTNCECHCELEVCKSMMQQEYDNLIGFVKYADKSLPRYKPNVKKDWWSNELSILKQQSINSHKLWLANGRPRHGPVNDERVRIRSAYKHAIRSAQRQPKQKAWNKLHDAMQYNNTNQFWSSWKKLYSKNASGFPTVVDGLSDKKHIAKAFSKCFMENSMPNNQSKVDILNNKFATEYQTYNQKHSQQCNCNEYGISLETTIDAICCLKNGKCGDDDGINAEHFHNAPHNFLRRLTRLLNEMLRHSFVPRQFRFGTMIPIIKDQSGNHGDISNYRGITISPILSKVLEHALKQVFLEHLDTSSSQFGFKRKNSTIHAIYCVKETIDYYINNGSRVYCSFLDASKAFDRLIHTGLFIKLMNRQVPKVFLDIIITWYDGLFCRVRWDNQFSEWFHVSAGVRQGGVLSPDFYGIYVDELVSILKASGVGCYFVDKFAAIIMYADDMVLLAPSLKGLQSLLIITEKYCLDWDVKLNPKKTKNMCFGKGKIPPHRVNLNGIPIEWVNKWTYLGVTLVHGSRFGCCIDATISKFYRAANAILRVEGRSDDIVMLGLLESHCVPILTYGIEVVHVTDRKQKNKFRVAYNSIFRKLFNFSWRESVTDLQHELGRPTWEELVDKRKNNFRSKCNEFPMLSLVKAINLYS